MRTYIALFKSNMRLTLRDRGALFFNYLFPLMFFYGFAGLFGSATGGGVSFYVGMVLTMGILGNGLWGAGMRSVQEREANILRRFKVTPITPMPILLAAMASGLLFYLPIVLLLLALAHFGYGMPFPHQWISLLLMTALGVCAFRAIGLILAAVTNTMQEAMIVTQLFYLPMLILSGATIPSAILPKWVQTLAEFMPASHLVGGFQGIFFRNQSILDQRTAVLALLITTTLGTFLAAQLFRWEKGEKIRPRQKAWVLVVLGPFLLIGGYRAFSAEHLGRNRAFYRDLERSGAILIRNARIFTAAGSVIENGSVLVRGGKIAEVYEGAAPDPETLKATAIEGVGKTLLPGLIDAHVHLSALGGVLAQGAEYAPRDAMRRAAAALLYSGVTSARSMGDPLDLSLRLRDEFASGAALGAQLFACGPVFAIDGRGAAFLTGAPSDVRNQLVPQLLRTPKSPEEARRQVRSLKAAGVDGMKAVVEADFEGEILADRQDLLLARSMAEEARVQKLPLAAHTGEAADVADAVEIGATSIEHGAWLDELPDSLLERMAARGVYYDPALSAAEAFARYYAGSADPLKNSLVEQTAPEAVLNGTRGLLGSGKSGDAAKAALFQHALEQASVNLLRAWKAGVPLAMGTDAGSPLVFHGASLHHELQLWVAAGIPSDVALRAATVNAAALLRAGNRIGAIRKGFDADLLLVDGDPVRDIAATERISLVVLKGERIRRQELFNQK